MYKVNDKAKNVSNLNRYMLAKTLSMFTYRGLPETIPQKDLELLLQTKGFAFFTMVEETPYVFYGGQGGELDEYYSPTRININNPALKFNEQLNINEDGVLIKNDDMQMGLYPLLEQFHSLMVENQITLDMYSFNSRALKFFSASDDKTKESADLFIKKLKEGEFTVIGDNAMFDGVKTHTSNSSGSSSITELIEYQQYLKSSLYGELGINSPFNMKRERVNSGEVNQHEESLSIFVDNMKENRDEALKKINQKYGLNIRCEFAGVWKAKREKDKTKTAILTDER